ncbi:EAL domain-containing protein [uncultured Clostridium sp.]|uniref:EAL and HDOD domain-containing protein n=1 Tax=uncultured Clostridium sp. TaxID=59620 RepID=UPI00260CEC61|nr:EAL domain-containing protein [uncultured Clostridium sp.]
MDNFLARQGIYDKEKKVIGYELLYRTSNNNKYDYTIEACKATMQTIKIFKAMGSKKLTEDKRAFINFPEGSIIAKEYEGLKREAVVIEILEDVRPTDKVLSRLGELKKEGYILALDDVSHEIEYEKFLNFIDIYKIDFIKTSKEERMEILGKIKMINGKAKFLAEKIENIEEYNEGIEEGYEYFQGYYLSKPFIIS